jgi:tetratricopeptide (TPR) repeat protein
MAGTKWWVVLVAAFVLGISGPALADDEADEDVGVEDSSATADALYEFLVAEFAAQRGDVEGALSIYHRLARELRDPQIARRAVETAFRARAFGPALESATLLLELDPESTLAREIMAALIANEGEIDKARVLIAGILDKSGNRGAVLMQLSHLYGKFVDKAAVLEATRTVTIPYLAMPESHYAIGVAALLAGKVDLATNETDAALELRPSWQQGAILKAQILRKSAPNEVMPFYQMFVGDHPASVEVRMQLGRELAAERKLAEAREQFREVDKLSHNDPQAAYAIGLLSLQLEDFADAQTAFTRALKQGYREPTAIYLGMGQAGRDSSSTRTRSTGTRRWSRATGCARSSRSRRSSPSSRACPRDASTCAASSRALPRTTSRWSRSRRSCCAMPRPGKTLTTCSRRRS